MGRLLLELAKDKLNFELGGGYVVQELIDAPHQNYASGAAYAKYEHAISESSSSPRTGSISTTSRIPGATVSHRNRR